MHLLETGLYSALAGAALLAGVGLVRAREQWARANTLLLAGFAAGTMMAITFLHLLPEAVEMTGGEGRLAGWALPVCLASFLGIYALEGFVIVHPCDEEECESHNPIGTFGYLALALHSVLDGVVIGVGFDVGRHLGILTTVAIVLHQLPVGVTAVSLLYLAGLSGRQVLVRTAVLAAATPVGAVGAALLLRGLGEATLGVFLAVSAGSFLYVGASHLIPLTHRGRRVGSLITVLGGAGVVLAAGLFHG